MVIFVLVLQLTVDMFGGGFVNPCDVFSLHVLFATAGLRLTIFEDGH